MIDASKQAPWMASGSENQSEVTCWSRSLRHADYLRGRSQPGHHWLSTDLGHHWLGTDLGHHWLSIGLGHHWLSTALTKHWFKTPLTKHWFRTPRTKHWLRTPLTKHWLRTPLTKHWLRTPLTKHWLRTPLHWLSTDLGHHWLSTDLGHHGLSTDLGHHWLSTLTRDCLQETVVLRRRSTAWSTSKAVGWPGPFTTIHWNETTSIRQGLSVKDGTGVHTEYRPSRPVLRCHLNWSQWCWRWKHGFAPCDE